MVHHYVLLGTKSENQDHVHRMLIGPPQYDKAMTVDERAGFVPPSWWRGDEQASRSGFAAMVTMRRR